MPLPSSQRVHVVGQGIAGTALAWCLHRAGLPFVIWDPGHETAASRVAAGIMNPVTGQRLVPSWRWSELLPQALALYRDIEYETGAGLLRPLRVRREFADERERRIFERRRATGEFGGAVRESWADGFWVEGAWQADSAATIECARHYFKSRGLLREEAVPAELIDGEPTVLCTGRHAAQAFPSLPLQPWEGAIASFPDPGLDPGVLLNRGVWVLPWGGGEARCGSTYWPAGIPAEARERELGEMLGSASLLVGQPTRADRLLTGWRVATSDRKPIAGWLPHRPNLGVLVGLGAKGSSLAPFLAGQWVAHLRHHRPFDAEIAPERFAVS